MFDSFTFLLVGVPLIIFSLIIAMLILFAVMKKRDKRLKDEMEAELKSQGIIRWSGNAEESILQSFLLDRTYLELFIYPNELVIGRASFRFHDISILVDFASYPFAKFVDQKLIVDSKKNDMLGRSRIDMTKAARDLKLVKLEGNFPTSFDVWYEENKQVEALTILNPASMTKLIDYFEKYDMEISSDRIYIYQLPDVNFFSSSKRAEISNTIKDLVEILK
jgi:hypothetical protein